MFGRRSAVLLPAVILGFGTAAVLAWTLVVVLSQSGCGWSSWLGCLRDAWMGSSNFRAVVFVAAAFEIIAVVTIAAVLLKSGGGARPRQ